MSYHRKKIIFIFALYNNENLLDLISQIKKNEMYLFNENLSKVRIMIIWFLYMNVAI